MKLAFLDTETTGLDVDRHEVWEVALILRIADESTKTVKETLYHWFLPVRHLEQADLFALKIGRFMQRHPSYIDGPLSNFKTFTREFTKLTEDAHIVGAVPSFDTIRLDKLIREFGYLPMWHYHLVDVEALIAGLCCKQPPWKSDDLSNVIGIDPTRYDKHTAMGDAEWVRDQYDAVMRLGK